MTPPRRVKTAGSLKISGGRAFNGLRMSDRATRTVANLETGAVPGVSGEAVRMSVPVIYRSFVRVEHLHFLLRCIPYFWYLRCMP
ncbi:hypothetical protein AGR4A_Cc150034 [Agrobacterium tumefaciens str. B6]|uniref:Uncharacterized protein n=1 Tax=Agrobacterium tumefaciens str. B6 TaxID=1183423 RepID=A0A822UU82_AGRTU|nr:hypothetical protein AGR4A_Cc150034 [Agrobacterium tumefaciens str. B6]